MAGRSAKVLIVDDEPRVCFLIEGVLEARGLQFESVYDGGEAARRLVEDRFDVAVIDMVMPGTDGIDLLKVIADRGLPTRAVCMTGVASGNLRAQARRAGACAFFEKPFDVFLLAEAVGRAAGLPSAADAGRAPARAGAGDVPDDFAAYHEALVGGEVLGGDGRVGDMLMEFAGALVQAVEAKDPYTRRHSEHVAFYAEHLADHLGLGPQRREAIRIAALLHDIGKIAIPDSVLTKPGRLSPSEFALVRQHPEAGATILAKISLMQAEARLVLHHHESWDGSGYPSGARGEDIPLGARILNIADSIDAMLMHRTYKRAYSVGRMRGELARCAGTQFDPALARAALRWCEQNPARLIRPAPTDEAESA